eukprot:482122-Amphidinium_carterae.4
MPMRPEAALYAPTGGDRQESVLDICIVQGSDTCFVISTSQDACCQTYQRACRKKITFCFGRIARST